MSCVQASDLTVFSSGPPGSAAASNTAAAASSAGSASTAAGAPTGGGGVAPPGGGRGEPAPRVHDPAEDEDEEDDFGRCALGHDQYIEPQFLKPPFAGFSGFSWTEPSTLNTEHSTLFCRLLGHLSEFTELAALSGGSGIAAESASNVTRSLAAMAAAHLSDVAFMDPQVGESRALSPFLYPEAANISPETLESNTSSAAREPSALDP
jgi:hypothetical protein